MRKGWRVAILINIVQGPPASGVLAALSRITFACTVEILLVTRDVSLRDVTPCLRRSTQYIGRLEPHMAVSFEAGPDKSSLKGIVSRAEDLPKPCTSTLTSNSIHCYRNCLVRLPGNGPKRHPTSTESLHDLFSRLNLVNWNGSPSRDQLQAISQYADR